ncbi:MAG: GNAT family N-acetyltransferase [Candidatus Onthomonas sp.]
MEIRHARPEDLPALLDCYAQARAFMAESGNPNQWKDSSPARSLIEGDIAGGTGYVAEENGVLLAAFALLPGPDPTYAVIEEGAWSHEGSYGVIHRMACVRRGRGVGTACIRWCQSRYDCLRVDTHQDNRPMQGLLAKNGFVPCGVICLANGEPRIGYQWH